MADIFVSYARDDAPIARALATELAVEGFEVWYDTSLVAGYQFAREIQTQIDRAQVVLVLWTMASIDSAWVLAEAQRAFARKKLVGILARGLTSEHIPLPYNALHTIDIRRLDDVVNNLQKRGVTPSRAVTPWSFYEEPEAVRSDALSRFLSVAGTRVADAGMAAKDPALDVRIEHATLYEYDRPVSVVDHTLRVHPSLNFTNFRDYTLRFLDPPSLEERGFDAFDNVIHRVGYRDKLQRFGFTVALTTNLTPTNPLRIYLEQDCDCFPFAYDGFRHRFLRPYAESEPADATVREFFREAPDERAPTTYYLRAIMEYLESEFRLVYQPDDAIGKPRSLTDIVRSKSGTTGERARLLVNLLRDRGLAARFVGGYLLDFLNSPARMAPDSWEVFYSGWVQVYLPGAGWIGLDPPLFTQENYIPLACGHSQPDTNIVEGMVSQSKVSLRVSARAAPTSRALLGNPGREP